MNRIYKLFQIIVATHDRYGDLEQLPGPAGPAESPRRGRRRRNERRRRWRRLLTTPTTATTNACRQRHRRAFLSSPLHLSCTGILGFSCFLFPSFRVSQSLALSFLRRGVFSRFGISLGQVQHSRGDSLREKRGSGHGREPFSCRGFCRDFLT